jgi:hypothetical protein
METVIIIVVVVCIAVAAFLWFRHEPVVIRQPHFTFPDDENGDVLRQMQAAGDNLEAEREMNFAFTFKTQPEAERFASGVTAQGFLAKASDYPERKMWQAEVTHFMLPTHEAITELESRLSKMAAEHGGSPDGWGSFLQP